MRVGPNLSATKLSHPFTFVCDVTTCSWRTAHKTEQDAYNMQATHQCPWSGKDASLMDEVDEKGQRYTLLHMGKSVMEHTWDYLDQAVDRVLEQGDDYSKGAADAYSRVLHKSLHHWYPTLEHVKEEAMKRRAIRTGEVEWSPTPGYRYNPPPLGTAAYDKAIKRAGGDFSVKTPAKKAATPRATTPEPAPNVSDEVRSKIINSINMGLFTDEDLVTAFKVPLSYINSLRNSIDS